MVGITTTSNLSPTIDQLPKEIIEFHKLIDSHSLSILNDNSKKKNKILVEGIYYVILEIIEIISSYGTYTKEQLYYNHTDNNELIKHEFTILESSKNIYNVSEDLRSKNLLFANQFFSSRWSHKLRQDLRC